MAISPTVLVAVASAIASIGTAVYLNRRKIRTLENWAWGRDRDETDAGVAGEHRSLDEKIDTIECKLDDELEQRRQDHDHVEHEIKVNRRFVSESINNLAAALNDQLPEADVDVEDDVEPDWVKTASDLDAPSFYGDDEPPVDD